MQKRKSDTLFEGFLIFLETQFIADEQLQNQKQNFGHVAKHFFQNHAQNTQTSTC